MKRTRLNKKSNSEIKTVQDLLWAECKRIIRARYLNECYTCEAKGLMGANWHTGHMIAKAALGAYMKYDLRVLRPQCYRCNMRLGGMGSVFIENMRKIEGNRYVNKILKDRNVYASALDHYKKLLEEYKQI